MELRIPGFDYDRVNIGSLNLNVAAGGSGTPLVLLHGFPQTHLAWRDVAVELAQDHLVISPDLRGYGASDKPPAEPGGETYSKRRMARDVIMLMRKLGHDRFCLVGHDRGPTRRAAPPCMLAALPKRLPRSVPTTEPVRSSIHGTMRPIAKPGDD